MILILLDGLDLIKNFKPGFPRLFKNCKGIYSSPILYNRPLNDSYYQEMFYNAGNWQVQLGFDSCFQLGSQKDNGEFYKWLYDENTTNRKGTIRIYSDQLFSLLQTNETARNMLVPSNWTYMMI